MATERLETWLNRAKIYIGREFDTWPRSLFDGLMVYKEICYKALDVGLRPRYMDVKPASNNTHYFTY